jgi:hypothetical protein
VLCDKRQRVHNINTDPIRIPTIETITNKRRETNTNPNIMQLSQLLDQYTILPERKGASCNTQHHKIQQTKAMTTSSRRGKRVRFSPFVSISAPGPLAFEEIRQLWYGQDALNTFRMESRRSLECPNETEDDSEEERIEGIGHCCRDRLKYSRMTIHCILSAHKKGVRAEIMSAIARRCNAWSTEAAHIRGARTYCELYQPAMTSAISSSPSVPIFPFSMKKRKSADQTGLVGDEYGQPPTPKRRSIASL